MIANAPDLVLCCAAAMAIQTAEQRELKAAARAAQPLAYVCGVCGKHLRRDDMEKIRRTPAGAQRVGKRCYKCRALARRTGGQNYIDMAPDREPAQHLLDLLADDRRAGMAFDQAWPAAVQYVLSCIPEDELRGWSVAFKETRGAWAAAWLRSPPVKAALTVDLLDVRDPVEISRSVTLVA